MRVSREKLIAYTRSSGVCAEEPIPSAIGLKIFLNGGNAVDAAIAISLSLAVTIPHLGGIGGDLFTLVKDLNGNLTIINGSGFAPRGLSEQFLRSQGLYKVPETGPLSPVIPGMIDGLRLLHEKFGSIEWKKLVKPAIELARKGFPSPPTFAKAIRNSKKLLMKDYGSRLTYLRKEFERGGSVVKFPGLARLLEILSEDPRTFYEGEIAERIVNYTNSIGGVMDLRDFKEYRAIIDKPLLGTYKGWKVAELPPNSQGLTTLVLLKILESEKVPKDPLERVIPLMRASKIAYKIRDEYLGDPRSLKFNPEEMFSQKFINDLVHKNEEKVEGNEGGDTTFFVVADDQGMVVAGIQSLFYAFGSGITEPTFQVTLNSRAQAFSLVKGRPNYLEPLKRPLHTLSIAMIENNGREIFLGLSGGNLRPQFHFLLISNIVDYNMDIGDAISEVRYGWMPGSNTVITDTIAVNKLKSVIGKELKVTQGRTGVASALEIRSNKVKIFASDLRGDGYPYILA